MHMKRKFTLLELLVVVSVVAILTALLLPALSLARATALRSQCLNHERQLMLGAMSYNCDWNDFIAGEGARYTGKNGWIHTNLDIYSSRDLQYIPPMRAPASTGDFFGVTWCDSILSFWSREKSQVYWSTYKVPCCVGSSIHYNTPYDGSASAGFLRLSRLPMLSQHIYFGEGSGGNGNVYSISRPTQNTTWGDRGIDFAHAKRANFMFLDGHGESQAAGVLPALPSFPAPVSSPW